MPNFCRDVLLPGAAAVGLLVAFTVGPARAHEEPVAAEPVATFTALAPRANPPANETDAIDVRDDVDATESVAQPESSIEPRCDRIRRIGKFTLTRCD